MKNSAQNKRKISVGGGGMMKSYKPLIATSLALALSASVASANVTDCNGNTSAICYSFNNGQFFRPITQVQISAGASPSTFNQLQSNGTALQDLTLQFQHSLTTSADFASSTFTLKGLNTQIKLTNKDKGLQLGDNGTSTLTIDFGNYNAANLSRKAIFDFEGKTGTTALKGNIKIIAGGSPTDKVEATFNGDMEGNITITPTIPDKADPHLWNFDYSSVTTNFTFKNGAKLKGNIEARLLRGEQNFTFSNGGIEGDIRTYGFIPYHFPGGVGAGADQGSDTNVNITFKNDGASIKKGNGSTGEIRVESGFYEAGRKDNNAHNRILFEGNGQIGGDDTNRMSIIAHTDGWNVAKVSEAHNLIQFQKQATLYLEKLAIGHYNSGDRLNVISLEGESNDILNINKIESRGGVNYQGRNYIGKGLLKFANGGNEAKDLVLSNIDEVTLKGSDYQKISTYTQTLRAKGILIAGAIGTIDEGRGINGVFIDTLQVTKTISSWGESRNIISTNDLTINGGVYSSGGGNIISITTSGTIGANGINSDGETNSRMDYSLFTAKHGNNIFYLEGDNTTLSFKKKIEHTWQAKRTEFNLNGTANKVDVKEEVKIGGYGDNSYDGVIFNFNGSDGELDIKGSDGTTSGGGNIYVGRDKTDRYAKLTLNFKGNNTTIKGNITTQGGGNINEKNTTTFNITNGNNVEVQGTIKNQKSNHTTDTRTPTDSAQTIFNFQSPTSGNGAITTLALKNNIENTSGNIEFNFNAGDSRVSVVSGETSKITTTAQGATTTFNLANGANATIEQAIETTAGSTNIAFNGNSTLTLKGQTNQITKLTANATESTLNLTNGTATITTTEIGNGSTLSFQSPNEKIKTDTLKLSTGAKSGKINLSSNAQTNLGTTHNFNLLEIGQTTPPDPQSVGLSSSNLTFVVSVDTEATQEGSKIGGTSVGASGGTYGHAYSDRVVILSVGNNNQGNTALKEQIAVAIDPSQTSSIKYSSGGTETEHNIAVATIKNRDNSDNVNNALATFTSIETINGGEKIQVEFVKVATNANGKVNGATDKGKAQESGDYTTYFLGKAISLGVDNTTQQALTSALSINYDLYIANLNSLNKRMGELRDNPYTQGVWARVFGGLQESNFGLGARTSYVTAQGGYDYALETEGAKNYIGLAFSYMHSKGESNKATQASNAINVSGINTIYLSNIQSSGYEIALYNSYVSNVGLYNDTIAKLSYITSDFSLSNSSDHNNTANNLGFTLSNEVGYRFILGEQQDYFIDPQLELSLGYLNQSDFTTKMKTRSGKGNQLKALQESVFLTRTRLGASFGKKIVEQDKNISLYVGTFYEYDLVTGGSNKLTTGTTKAYNPEFASNGRVVLNVGSNLELNQSTRVYVDVEKSFGDKLRTQLQFNLGARYSFGEKTSIENAKAQTTAPLRVGNTPTEETEKAQIVPNVPHKAKEDTRAKATNQ
ncbi:hypothetical protein BBW65_00740 [Helicobacter enhydrae]|uniref:Autotransporter domain-containing protein n=1 Tax=Helicobacter enhydrae TaxID=222136 RepID=A0A1B1U3U1_9HELI|nr:autotransporter outer membrane beta-barrel domain-containing protein [Helicobacter enhydrae]ANV97430.1 hypothetical protein BBW65_00740 [Helicobacter enhydrae]